MKKIFIFTCIALGFTSIISCKKFLDITPKGKVILQTISDYDKWLNQTELVTAGSYLMNNMTDQVDLPNINLINQNTARPEILVYIWNKQFVLRQLQNSEAPFWRAHFNHILLYNTVVNNVENAIDGTPQIKQSLKAEAMLGRALEYFYLINLYAKVYDKNTASTDLGVPIVEDTDVNQVISDRKSVQQVYDYIIKNIESALPNLPDDNSINRFRGSKAAAHGVLARTYLFMGEYQKATSEAQKALSLSNATVADLNSDEEVDVVDSPNEIYGKLGNELFFSVIYPLAYINAMDRNDLRYLNRFNYRPNSFSSGETLSPDSVTYTQRGSITNKGVIKPNFAISAVEMQFIIAEAAARNNDLETAVSVLNDEILSKRYEEDSFEPFESDDKDEILAKIFKERSFEFPYNGLRWLDMRRLDKEGKMPAVQRVATNGTTILGTLEPKSPRYVLQIPQIVINYNPNMKQN